MLAPFERFYPTAKALYMWRMRRRYRSYPNGPILLLQLGKVGSKSVQAGLEAVVTDRPIYHAHFLSRERTAETEAKRRKFFRTDRHTYLMRPWLNQFLLRTYESGDSRRAWKLITLTREPIGRNVSAFFENLDVVELPDAGEYEIRSDYYDIAPTVVSVDDTKKLAELFYSRATHDSALHFFDREIRDIFGIDVFASGFATARGWDVYTGDRAEMLVMRLEDLQETAEAAMKAYLDLDDFELINQNIGAEKVYAPLYKAFKKNVVIGSAYADELLTSDYTRTFYSSEEIDRMRERWLGRAAPAPAQSAS